MAAEDPVAALRRRGGVARWSDIVDGTGNGRTLEAAVADLTVIRVGRGTYALPGVEPDLITACVHRGRLTCVSAAAHHGLVVLQPPEIPHLSVPRSRGSTASSVRASHAARLHREDRVPVVHDDRLPVVPLDHALARMLLCAPVSHAIVTIDSALGHRWVTVDQIRAALPVSAPSRATAALLLADGRSQSPTETLARLALRAAGLHTVPAARIPRVGLVDLLVEGQVVVELDGFAYHSGRTEYREDRRRDRELAAQRYVVLRFTFEDVVRDPDIVVRAVRATLAAGSPASDVVPVRR